LETEDGLPHNGISICPGGQDVKRKNCIKASQASERQAWLKEYRSAGFIGRPVFFFFRKSFAWRRLFRTAERFISDLKKVYFYRRYYATIKKESGRECPLRKEGFHGHC
jgi:hypothetical protein